MSVAADPTSSPLPDAAFQDPAGQPRILIVSPVRNEAAHIERVVRSVAAQELAPARWIVIDDSSTDDTLELVERLAEEIPFMEVRSASEGSVPDGTPDRLARAAAPRNFNLGLGAAEWRDYTHIMKLDGDIELQPDYLRRLMDYFAADSRHGLAGGVIVEPTPTGGFRPVRIPRNHVNGALKCYSRECFSEIGGVQERLGWDTIDETYARMRGYATVSHPDLVCVHHRPCGSADGQLRGHARHGECAYISHYPLLWVSLRSFKVAFKKPQVISGGAFLLGYARAAARRVERVPDREYRRFTRRELHRRLGRAVLLRRESA